MIWIGFGILFVTSISLMTLSFIVEKKHPIVEGKQANAYVLSIRFVHYFVFFFNILYIFLFAPNFALDVFYIFVAMVIYLHWLCFNNECVLSYLENKYYNDNYRLENNRGLSYYWRVFWGDQTKNWISICGIVALANFIVVLFRQTYLSINMRLSLTILFITYIYVISIWKTPGVVLV
jgi:hypothetical protein